MPKQKPAPAGKAKAAKKPAAKKAAPKRKLGRKPVVRDKLDVLGTDKFVERVTGGESFSSVARSLNVSLSALAEWIERDSVRSARVKSARILSAGAYADKAEDELKGATDHFGLAKAKELAHHYRWVSKTRDPGTYGDKQLHGGANDLPPIQHNVSGEITMTPNEAYMRMLGKA